MAIFNSYVKLPEGTLKKQMGTFPQWSRGSRKKRMTTRGHPKKVKAKCPEKFAWECDDGMWVMGPIGDTLLKKLRDQGPQGTEAETGAETGRLLDDWGYPRSQYHENIMGYLRATLIMGNVWPTPPLDHLGSGWKYEIVIDCRRSMGTNENWRFLGMDNQNLVVSHGFHPWSNARLARIDRDRADRDDFQPFENDGKDWKQENAGPCRVGSFKFCDISEFQARLTHSVNMSIVTTSPSRVVSELTFVAIPSDSCKLLHHGIWLDRWNVGMIETLFSLYHHFFGFTTFLPSLLLDPSNSTILYPFCWYVLTRTWAGQRPGQVCLRKNTATPWFCPWSYYYAAGKLWQSPSKFVEIWWSNNLPSLKYPNVGPLNEWIQYDPRRLLFLGIPYEGDHKKWIIVFVPAIPILSSYTTNFVGWTHQFCRFKDVQELICCHSPKGPPDVFPAPQQFRPPERRPSMDMF